MDIRWVNRKGCGILKILSFFFGKGGRGDFGVGMGVFTVAGIAKFLDFGFCGEVGLLL